MLGIPLAMAAVILPLLLVMGFLFMGTSNEETTKAPNDAAISAQGSTEIPAAFIPIYQAAAKEYGVPWNLLAAIHRVETMFSTIGTMESYAGAEGHMQFMPCTWTGWGHPSCGGLGRGQIAEKEKTNPAVIKRYGGYGVDGDKDGKADPFNEVDAIYTAASYLSRSGAADGDIRKAVFTYNHSEKYVADVMGYMDKYAVQAKAPAMVLSESTGGFARPVNDPVTSQFGQRFHPVLKIWRLHGGIDFDCTTGDAIAASRPGVVSYAGWFDAGNPKAGYGLYVWVDHGGGYKTGYNHLSSLNVSVGDNVVVGDVVGACGNTGTSTGDHLHFEIFKSGVLVDPRPYLGL